MVAMPRLARDRKPGLDRPGFPVPVPGVFALQRNSVVNSNQPLSSVMEAWYLPLPTHDTE
jgi:hypothetical protein